METCVYILRAGEDCKHAYVNICEHTYGAHVLPRSAHCIIQLEPRVFINSSNDAHKHSHLSVYLSILRELYISAPESPSPPVSLNPPETPRRPLT